MMTLKAVAITIGAVILTMAGMASSAAAAEVAGTYAELPGVKLWFTDSGGSGVPLVMLHANTGNSEIWEGQVGAFARAGYRVIAFDRRGWGKSLAEPATGPQPGTIAGDLDALADHLKLDRFHLLGIAGGGFAALDYAAWRGERLRSLVIGASTGQIADPEIAQFAARIEIPGLRKLPPVYLEVSPSYRGANLEGTKRWREIEEHSHQDGAPNQPLRTPNTFAKIATIATPTLVIAADADLLAPPALMRVWAEHLINREWAVVPDAGHAMAWERPDLFNERVLGFVGRH